MVQSLYFRRTIFPSCLEQALCAIIVDYKGADFIVVSFKQLSASLMSLMQGKFYENMKRRGYKL